MTLRTRFAMVTGVIVLVVVALVGFGAYAAAANQLYGQVDDSLDTRVNQIADALQRNNRPMVPGFRQRNPITDELLQTEFDAVTQIIDPTSGIVATAGKVDLPEHERDDAMASSGDGFHRETVSLEGGNYRILTVAMPNGVLIKVGKNVNDIDDAIGGMRAWFIGIAVAGFGLAAIAGWMFASKVSKPIELLASSADDIAQTQDLDHNVEVTGANEVTKLASSFNTMLAALRRSVTRQRQLVQDASHELRTPLTSLRANTELLQRPSLSDSERTAILADMRAEIDELTELSSELSALATDQKAAEQPTTVDLREVADEIATRARRRTTGDITVSSIGETHVTARMHQLERAISNLVDNAIKFSPDGSDVAIIISDGRIVVQDNGPGISTADKPHVFDRFYRATATRSLPGSGLGLAIVAQFAEDHGIATIVEDAPNGGAVVGLQF
jgi:two-component system sensor histidine kinase MprB